MEKILVIILGLLLTFPSIAARKPIYKDPSKSIEERVEDLLSRMTLEEKVLQLNQYTLGRNDNANNFEEQVHKLSPEIGSVIYFSDSPELRNSLQKKAMEESRLGIPVVFGFDVIHGYRTILPVPIAQACSFDPELVEEGASVAAMEAKKAGVDWTFSPMVDIARDPRWGRVAEGYGEDPYLASVMAAAAVRGYQGTDPSDGKHIAACMKHFVAYGASEAGRDYVYTEVSRQSLWDTYLPSFEAGVRAGAMTVMSSFNCISGIPSSADSYTLTEVLKNRWGFDGFIVSDWGSIQQLRSQGFVSDKKEAAMASMNAGLDMDMMNECYDAYLEDLVKEGKVSEARLDDAVRRVLRMKFRLGLFEHPYVEPTKYMERFLLPEYLETARRLAEESMVLLKNDGGLLPLSKPSSIAVIGPMAESRFHHLGSWQGKGTGEFVVNTVAGLKKRFPDAQIVSAQGCDFDGGDRSGFEAAVKAASEADVVFLCLGEKNNWSGENASRSTIALPAIQQALAEEIAKAGKPIVLVTTSGRPLDLHLLEPLATAMIQEWQTGLESGNALAALVSGDYNPSGRLAITFPYSTGQIPIYYNHRQSARTNQGFYQDIPSKPLYDFGYGLSYTTYSYGKVEVSDSLITKDSKIRVRVPVTNSGSVDGTETAMLFIRDPYCSVVTRPVKELKRFSRHEIKAGETYVFVFELDPQTDLSFVDSEGRRFLESGEYDIIVKDQIIRLTLK